MARVSQAGQGVVVYLRGHEGRGVGLINKLHAYRLQDEGRDTVEANLDLGLPVDSRRYDVGAQILVALGLTTIRVMSNNPAKFAALEGYPLRIVERVPLITETNPENPAYLLCCSTVRSPSMPMAGRSRPKPPAGSRWRPTRS
jgi:3,4-dihydroxy 2-butanone 4-phosphate synthase/GTP cyclohydrolase II